MSNLKKIHTESIDRILKETSDQLGKMKPIIINQSIFDKFPKVRAAQIDGPDIDMEPIIDRNGKVDGYLERLKAQYTYDEFKKEYLFMFPPTIELDHGERIITKMGRNNEPVKIVVDEFGKYKRILK